jgi:hypothetical protein
MFSNERKVFVSMRLARLIAASAAFTVAVGLTAVAPSSAVPPVPSVLVPTPATITVNVNPTPALGEAPHTASVSLKLDSNCHQATDSTGYTVVPGPSSFVSVSDPDGIAVPDCDQSAVFSITGLAVTDADGEPVHFSAVGKNNAPGLDKKLEGVNVTVIVVNTTPDSGGCEPNCPVSGGRPAAPAIANGLLKAVPGLAGACKAHFKNAKNWKGQTISTIAGAMPKPESVKNTYSSDEAWTDFVALQLGSFDGLYGLCEFPPASV